MNPVRRLLAGFIVFFVAATPAADAYCRAACLTPAAEAAADQGGHCALHQSSAAGPAMNAQDGPCANPHAETRVQQAAIKIERATFAPAAVAPAVMSSRLLAAHLPAAVDPSFARPAQPSPFNRLLPLRC